MNTKITPKKLLIFSLVAIVIYYLIGMFITHIVVNVSNSHSGIIFWKSDEKPEKSDLVYFDFEHELLPKKFKTLSKRLICIENDNLVINDQFIVCNKKKYRIKRNIKTGSGKSIEQFYYSGIVPKNKAVVWGSNLESFDSRYWGFINLQKTSKMKLIF